MSCYRVVLILLVVLCLLCLLCLAGCGSNNASSGSSVLGKATLIETNNSGDAVNPQIAIDASGNAVSVWQQYDGTLFHIWSNRYTASTNSWGTPVLIETNNAENAYVSQIAVNASGNAVVVWMQYDGTRYNAWSNRYTAATGTWGTAVLIETNDSETAVYPQVAIDSAGNAMAVWCSDMNNIYANRYTAATGTWGTPVLIETNNAGIANQPQVSMDASGNAMAVWYQSDGTRYNIYANRYTASTSTWGAAVLIETNDLGHAYNPRIAIDASGNAMVVWYQSKNSGFNASIYANRYTAATGTWGTAVLIDADNSENALLPQVAIDAAGNALVVWLQYDGTRNNIWSNRYTAATGTWGTAAQIETNDGDALYPQIAMNAAGNAVAVWMQFDSTSIHVWSNRYAAATGTWGTGMPIEDNVGNVAIPQVAIDASGNAMAVWYQSDGTRTDIWSNRY